MRMMTRRNGRIDDAYASPRDGRTDRFVVDPTRPDRFVVDRNSTLDRSTRSFSFALISINHPFVCRSFERLGNSTEPNRTDGRMTASSTVTTTRANPSAGRSAEAGTNFAGARDALVAIEGLLLVGENATTTRERRSALEEGGRASAKRADGVVRRRAGVENEKDDDDDGCASSSVDPFSPSAKVDDARERRDSGETRLGRDDARDGLTTTTTTTTPATTRANAADGVTATTPNDAVFALESAFEKVRISPTNPFEFGSAKDGEDEASPSPSASSRDEPELEPEGNLTPKSRQLSDDFERCDAVEEKTPDAKDGVGLHRTSAPGAPSRNRNRNRSAAGSADFAALDVRSDPVDLESIAPRRLFDADE